MLTHFKSNMKILYVYFIPVYLHITLMIFYIIIELWSTGYIDIWKYLFNKMKYLFKKML